jgi:peptide/nickel transport system permease protein
MFAAIAGGLRREPFMLALALILAVLVSASVLVPILSGVDPNRQALLERLQPPTWNADPHVFGTDQLGRPLWIRLVYGLRTSYIVALLAVLLSFAIGVTLGLIAGYIGGWLDDVIMRAAEIQMALPAMLLALSVLASAGGGIIPLIIILGLDNWMLYMRVTRTLVRGMRDSELVVATRGLGARTRTIVFRHILPNASTGLIAVATVELSRVMLAESALSFLGFGVHPPNVSLGLILAQGRDYLGVQWWVSTLAGGVLTLAVLCTSLLGNWLRQITDPQHAPPI